MEDELRLTTATVRGWDDKRTTANRCAVLIHDESEFVTST
jgi:hypothetical protein